MIARVVAAEVLDELAVDDPRAVRARRDLRRVHRVMGTRSILLRGLADLRLTEPASVPRLLELGAGDGTLMLGVAKSLAHTGLKAHIALLDRQPCVEGDTIDQYAAYGWSAVTRIADVEDWIRRGDGDKGGAATRWDGIVANLFLHHFSAERLAALLAAVAARTDRFFACEPRRGWLALVASHLVGLIGGNAVTRGDAVLSVHAGFTHKELSGLWPAAASGWRLNEYGAGLFSHCLSATRVAPQ